MSSDSFRRSLDLEAARRGDVLEVDAAERRARRPRRSDDLVDVGGVRHSGNASTPANSLNSIALPSITGIAASGPMSPRPSTAVPSETTATVLPLIVSVQADSGSSWIAERDARDARRVGHREVVAGLDRDLAVDLDLAALVHQERAVRDARDLHAVQRPHRVDDALTVRGVDARHGHVARDAALVDAHEVDRAEDRALVADRARHRGERARELAQLDAHGEGVGGRGLEPRRRLQAGHASIVSRGRGISRDP